MKRETDSERTRRLLSEQDDTGLDGEDELSYRAELENGLINSAQPYTQGSNQPFHSTVNYQIGYSDGYRDGLDYGSANVRRAIFAYELNSRVRSAIMKVIWRVQRFYYRVIRPDEIPF